jgi:hypothetical protein
MINLKVIGNDISKLTKELIVFRYENLIEFLFRKKNSKMNMVKEQKLYLHFRMLPLLIKDEQKNSYLTLRTYPTQNHLEVQTKVDRLH